MKKVLTVFTLLSLFILSACGTNKEEYEESLVEAQDNTMSVSTDSEKILDVYNELWYGSIQNDISMNTFYIAELLDVSEDDIENYFNVNNDRVTDGYNDVVLGLEEFYLDRGDSDDVEEAISGVKSDVKDLNEPPDGYDEAFDKLLEMYSLSEEMADLAISPTGSYDSFSEKYAQLKDDIIKLNKEIDVVLPNE